MKQAAKLDAGEICRIAYPRLDRRIDRDVIVHAASHPSVEIDLPSEEIEHRHKLSMAVIGIYLPTGGQLFEVIYAGDLLCSPLTLAQGGQEKPRQHTNDHDDHQ